MAKDSIQSKLDRVRKPRVQIKYEVEIGDAMELKELPFVLGVLGDYTGKPHPDKPLPPLKDRKLVEIDRDNFNSVLKGMAPRLAFSVDDKLSGEEGQKMNVELNFKDMDDFSPESVAKQVGPLKELLGTRENLKNLLGKMEGNDKLEGLLEQVMQDTDLRKKLADQMGVSDSGGEEKPEQ